MSKKNDLISELNPSLVILRDNKAKWYLPETRRDGYRNLHKINRYGLLFRSDLVLKLNTNFNKDIEKKTSVKIEEITIVYEKSIFGLKCPSFAMGMPLFCNIYCFESENGHIHCKYTIMELKYSRNLRSFGRRSQEKLSIGMLPPKILGGNIRLESWKKLQRDDV